MAAFIARGDPEEVTASSQRVGAGRLLDPPRVANLDERMCAATESVVAGRPPHAVPPVDAVLGEIRLL
jgi:hypothetical protein